MNHPTGSGILSARIKIKSVSLIMLFFSLILLSITTFVVIKSILSHKAPIDAGITIIAGVSGALLLILLSFYLLMKELAGSKATGKDTELPDELFKITLNNIRQGIIATNNRGDITYMNAAAESITGWKENEAVTNPFHKVYDVSVESACTPFENIMSRILQKGIIVEPENNTILKTKHLAERVIINNGSPVFDKKGAIKGAVLVFDDITEQKKKEILLKESGQQYRDFIENLPEAVYTCDAEGYVQLYNKAAVKLWGRTPVIGKDKWCGSWKTFNADGTGITLDKCPMSRTLTNGIPVHGERKIVQRPDGSYRHILPRPSPLFDANGKLTGAINMVSDITDEVETQIATKKTEEQYRNVVEQASDGIFSIDHQGNILNANTSGCKMLGYSKNGLLNVNISSLVPEQFMGKAPIRLHDLVSGQTMLVERQFKRKNGDIFYAEASAKIIGDNIQCIVRDITERKKAELEIQRNASIIDATSDLVGLADLDLKIMFLNKAARKTLQYNDDDVAGLEVKDFLMPADENILNTVIKPTVLKEGKWRSEAIWLRKDGSKLPVVFEILLHKDSFGKPLYFSTVGSNITERKKAEQHLKKQRNLLDDVINSLPGVFFLLDENMKFLRWNRNFEKVTGYAADEIANMHPFDFFDNDEKQSNGEKIENVLTKGETSADACVYTRTGEKIPFQLTGHKIENDGKVLLLGVGIDISKRKMAEKALAESETHLRTIYNTEPECIKLMNEKGEVLDMNAAGLAMIEVDNLEMIKGKSACEIILPKYRPAFVELTKNVFRGLDGTLEFEIVGFKGTHRWLETNAVPLRNAEGHIISLLSVTRDITKRKDDEVIMKSALERYHILAEATSDTIWDWNLVENKIIYNKGISNVFGYDKYQVDKINTWWKENIHYDDFDKVSKSLYRVFKENKQTLQLEYRFRCADNSYKYVFDRAFIMYDENKRPSRVIGAMQDVTYAKEEALRISKAIVAAQEEERQQIGMDLHDNINQILAASLIYLDIAKAKDGKTIYFLDAIAESRNFIMTAIDENRRLSHRLTPTSHVSESMEDIFESLIRNMTFNQTFTVDLKFDNFNNARLSPEIQTALYRILQEQLNNIIKYAEANKVEVHVRLSDTSVKLIIGDNGKGFDPGVQKNGIGLENMKRRTEVLSGRFTIDSGAGLGCKIIADIPIAS